jgi:hypothetical protein
MPALVLAYDFGTVATPITVALIGALTVGYQVRTQRSNSADHGHVVRRLNEVGDVAREVREDVRDVKAVVIDHLAHHAHEDNRTP